jgi:WD40 repeat protein
VLFLSSSADAPPATRKPTATLTGHRGWVDLAFSPDGKTLAAGGQDGTVRSWNVAKGRVVATVTVAPASAVPPALAFSPDGRTMATGGPDGIMLWDTSTWRSKGSIAGQTGTVDALAFSPDGRALAAGGRGNEANPGLPLRLLDVAGGTSTDFATADYVDYGVGSIKFSPDGRTLATDGNGTVLWDVATGRAKATLMQGGGSAAFSPSGKILATRGDDSVLLWNMASPQPTAIHTRFSDGALAFSPDGKAIAIGGTRTVQLWNVTSGRPITALLTSYTNDVSSVAFSPDGKTVAAGSDDGTILLWTVR